MLELRCLCGGWEGEGGGGDRREVPPISRSQRHHNVVELRLLHLQEIKTAGRRMETLAPRGQWHPPPPARMSTGQRKGPPTECCLFSPLSMSSQRLPLCCNDASMDVSKPATHPVGKPGSGFHQNERRGGISKYTCKRALRRLAGRDKAYSPVDPRNTQILAECMLLLMHVAVSSLFKLHGGGQTRKYCTVGRLTQ